MFWRKQPPEKGDGTASKIVSDVLEPSIPAVHADLWARILAFPIDDPTAEVPLSKRLANEQKWKQEFSLRVVEEYRKFIFMTMISERMCTPSLCVDEAWHLHLIYTRSYWEGLCLRTLGRLIHHQPGNGNAEEDAVFVDHYLATLELYSRLFGPPPEDIWGHDQNWRRKPAACAAIRTAVPDGPIPEGEQALMLEIEKAAARLKKFKVAAK
jgi:hypothetical protein